MTPLQFVPLDRLDSPPGKTFFERAEEHPCSNCSAPCCRMLLLPHPTPATFVDLDYIRYMVGFGGVKMILTADGQWQVMLEQNCSLLDRHTRLCTVHGTPRQPKICVTFSPYGCWYKRNFTTSAPPDLVRIDAELLERMLAYVRFDDDDAIVELPPYEIIRELAAERESAQTQPAWFPIVEDDVAERQTAMAQ